MQLKRIQWIRVWQTVVTATGWWCCTGCALLGDSNELSRAKPYQLVVPAGWKTIDKAESDRAYQLSSGGIATVTSSCKKNPDAPLEVLTRHLLIGARNIEVGERKKIMVNETPGLFTRMKATFEGVRTFLVVFVIAKSGCVFDFTLVNNKQVADSDVEEFINFIKSFQYGKT